MNSSWLFLGTLFGFLGVALGAFGAHGLREVLDAYGREIYEKAVFYQLIHALALLAVGIVQRGHPQASLALSGWAFTAGIILFSGSLYLLAISGSKWLGAVTPLGGLAFLLGWAWMALQVLKLKP